MAVLLVLIILVLKQITELRNRQGHDKANDMITRKTLRPPTASPRVSETRNDDDSDERQKSVVAS